MMEMSIPKNAILLTKQARNAIIKEVRGDILENEKQGDKEPLRYVQIVYGEESVTIHKRQDLPSFRRFRGQREGNAGAKISSDNRTEQNGRGNAGTNNEIAPIKTSSDGDVFFDAKDGFEYRTAFFQDEDGEYYKLKISIGKNGDVATVYNVGKIKKTACLQLQKLQPWWGHSPVANCLHTVYQTKAKMSRKIFPIPTTLAHLMGTTPMFSFLYQMWEKHRKHTVTIMCPVKMCDMARLYPSRM